MKGTIKENYIYKYKGIVDEKLDFDINSIERIELNVNLIHFDLNMTNPQNYGYYCNFKVNVVGGFLAMDNLEMFSKYLKVIDNKNIPFIVISSGSSGKDVIEICKKYSFVKEVIIFCANYERNLHYILDYPELVKRVFIDINAVYEYIFSFGPDRYKEGIENYRNSNQFMFSYEDIKMDKQLEQCPVISAYEYDNCYYVIHKAYAQFFGDIDKKDLNVTFTRSNYNKIAKYIKESKVLNQDDKNELLLKFDGLVDKKNFVELALNTYTQESCFCYIFNRYMRNFEVGLISFAYFMGPFLFGLNKYVKEHPRDFAFKKDMTLYRNLKCSIYDYYLYKLNLNHIICFPSITSTSHGETDFEQTTLGAEANKNGFNEKDMINLTLIFNYKYSEGNISPGIIIKKNKGTDGKIISANPDEKEVILFPFTFARIKKIEEKTQNRITNHTITFDIINRKEYIEKILKENPKKRFLFSKLD